MQCCDGFSGLQLKAHFISPYICLKFWTMKYAKFTIDSSFLPCVIVFFVNYLWITLILKKTLKRDHCQAHCGVIRNIFILLLLSTNWQWTLETNKSLDSVKRRKCENDWIMAQTETHFVTAENLSIPPPCLQLPLQPRRRSVLGQTAATNPFLAEHLNAPTTSLGTVSASRRAASTPSSPDTR